MFLKSFTRNRSWSNTFTSDCILSIPEATMNLGRQCRQCTLGLPKTLIFEGDSSLISSLSHLFSSCAVWEASRAPLLFASLYFSSWITFEATLLYAVSGIGSTSRISSVRLSRNRKLFRLNKKSCIVLAIVQVIAFIIAFFFLVGTRKQNASPEQEKGTPWSWFRRWYRPTKRNFQAQKKGKTRKDHKEKNNQSHKEWLYQCACLEHQLPARQLHYSYAGCHTSFSKHDVE